MEQLTIPFVGPERAGRMYPFGSLLRAGATHRDGLGLERLDGRPAAPDGGGGRARQRRAPRPAAGRSCPTSGSASIDALAGFTRGSAWVNHLDGEVGSIEVGKAADLVVLDRDLFDRGAGAIGEARVVATFIDGEAVYERPELDG